MKKQALITLTFMLMFFFTNAQKIVYSSDGKTHNYKKEEISITFPKSEVAIPGEELAPLLLALIPSAIDLGFKIANNALERNKKKYSGEYVEQKSYLEGGLGKIPNIVFQRKVDGDSALTITINALPVKGRYSKDSVQSNIGFVYYIDEIILSKSKAKLSKGDLLDYTIEIKPTFFIKGEKKAQELFPITVTSVKFGTNDFNNNKDNLYNYRTDIIPLAQGSLLSEVSIKIVETNPAKVKTEKILELVTSYKDDAKTIINNFIENSKKEGGAASGDKPTGNTDSKTGNK